MFDAESADYSSNSDRSIGARGRVLRASLMRVFWRAPRWYESAICAVYAYGAWFWSNFAPGTIAVRALIVVLMLRCWQFVFDYCERKWPEKEISSFFLYYVYFLIFALPIIKFIFQSPPDWKGSLAFIAMLAAGFAWLFPLLWSLDRVFKP